MRHPTTALLLAASLALASARDGLAASSADTLGFEVPGAGTPFAGWGGGPHETISRDSTIVHGGKYSARIERGPTSPNQFSSITATRPITFRGDTLRLSGWLKTDGVTGFAGLWMREDSPSGVVQFDNMQDRGLAGTTGWTRYTIRLPLDKSATTLVWGALIVGQGTLHADDLELLVDGKPLGDALPATRETTVLDTDHEFDAGSKITATKLSSVQVENLALLARVWGFLKYHHPRVTQPAYHWDYELFRVMPGVLAARDRAGAQKAVVAWLDRIGEAPPCKPCAALPDSTVLKPRIAWIHDRVRLGRALSERLERVYANRDADGRQFYVAQAPFVGNPDFSKERGYGTPKLPDAGYRMLAVFRFWNALEYWFPYRDLSEPWDAVLTEFLPRAAAAETEQDYRLAMLAMVAKARDGHANVWNALDARPPRGDSQLPVVVRRVEGRFVVAAHEDSARGAASGLLPGDVLVALDGTPVDSIAAAMAPFIGASNAAARDREIAQTLTRGVAGPCRVTIERDGARQELTVARAATSDAGGRTHDLRGETFRLLAPDVAYLKLSSVVSSDVESYVQRASGTACFVIDIRNYPSAFMPFALGGHLVDKPTAFARFTTGDLKNPGAFTWTEPISIPPVAPRYTGKVVVLVDESSMSQSEYTAMALRSAPGAIVVGSTTAGADGNVSAIQLPGGLRAMISGIGVFYPDGTPTQQVGIVPDLVVTPTIAGLRAGRDEVLEAALKKALGRDFVIRTR